MPQPRYPQRPLHRGYRYQDLIAALAMAAVLAEGSGQVEVETKRFAGDRFDDLIVVRQNRTKRAQVKTLQSAGPLRLELFERDQHGLRLDLLVAGDAPEDGSDLRIVSPIAVDGEAPEGLVADADSDPLVPGLESSRWRLDPNLLWPPGEDPCVPVPAGISRGEFLTFCAHFVIEAEATPMSGTLANPGPLERSLVECLRDRAGVEDYPNRTDATNVAGRLLEVATSLRTREGRALDFSQVAAECGLRVDRGQVAQSFPLDRARMVPRVPLRQQLEDALDRPRVIVEGPPGSGKSWTLEAFAQDLRAEGWVVARHYCFLAPGDPAVAQRVAVEAMTANLASELLQDPRLEDLGQGLSGEFALLQRLLNEADERLAEVQDGAEARIALIVDGLDHVARVEPATGALAASPDDFAAQLALLELPERVMLIVGSQPGAHLDPMRERGATTIAAPALELRHTAGLLARQGVLRAIRNHGARADHAAAVAAVHEQAGGNPLYASFLGREIVRGLEAEEGQLPSERVRAISGAGGDLEAYYEHLMATVEQAPDDGVIAEHLALVDFALTQAELAEIFPQYGSERLVRILSHLRPILDEVGTQGGVRVHHESFRRFIAARIDATGRALAPLLNPVISWLGERGLFADERAFRFLLPLLRRVGQDEELLELIGPDFVSSSVVALQPYAAVMANLHLAADVAATRENFPALVRIAELVTAATVAYLEKLADPSPWAAGLIELEGGERLASRLLFEGRPTWPRKTGLRLCALIDQAGGDPPWASYLEMAEGPSNEFRSSEEEEQLSLDELRGRLRLGGAEGSVPYIADRLNSRPRFSETLLAGSAVVLSDVLGTQGLSAILSGATGAEPRALAWLELVLAESLASGGETERALAMGRQALRHGVRLSTYRRLLDLGVPAVELERSPSPEELLDSVVTESLPEAEAVSPFLTALFVAAARGSDLMPIREGLEGAGFYRAWLRFCCDLAEAEVRSGDVVAALEELSHHTAPFVGNPRACDLFSIHDLCHESFRRAASLVPAASWPQAWRYLRDIAAETTTLLSGSPGGPLTGLVLAQILLPYARLLPLAEVREELLSEPPGDYYDFHAEVALLRGRFESRAGDPERGRGSLAEAGRFIASYGFRKDVSVFGLIEALKPLNNPSLRGPLSERFVRLRPLCHRAYLHSDGRETNHASSAWFAAFAKHSCGAAARLLTRTLLEDKPVESWVSMRAVEALLRSAGPEEMPALLHHLLWRCCVPAPLSPWLEVIERLAVEDESRAQEAFLELAAAVDGDSEAPDPAAAEDLRNFAEEKGWPVPAMDELPDLRGRSRTREASERRADGEIELRSGPYLEGVDSELTLLLCLRDHDLAASDRPIDIDAFAEELVGCMRQIGVQQVVDLIAAFSTAQRFWESTSGIIQRVAGYFEEEPATAAALFVLAWAAVHDDWDPFGGLKHGELLTKAFETEPLAARRQLAKSFAGHLHRSRYGVGFTRRAAEALSLAGGDEEVLACWDAATAVVEHRLPPTGQERPPFAVPGPDLDATETVRAFAGMLGAFLHLPAYECRAGAMGGIAEMIGFRPDLAAAAIDPLFELDAAFTDLLLVLRLLEIADLAGEVSIILRDRLREAAAAPGLGLRQAAKVILLRLGEEVDRPATELTMDESEHQIPLEEILVWDSRSRVKRLELSADDFSSAVVARYSSLFNGNRSRTLAIIEGQAETQFSRADRWVPPLPIHRWEAELLEVAVHDCMEDLADRLPGNRAGNESQLHAFLAADVGAAIGRGRSRQLRPSDLPPPADRNDEEGEPQVLQSGPFAGWVRMALVESEIREGSVTDSGSFTTVSSGVWHGSVPDDLLSPFRQGSVDNRWHGPIDAIDQPEGALVVRWQDRHLSGYTEMLVPAPEIMELLGLTPAPIPAALALLDAEGRETMALRCWRMRPYSYDYHPRIPMIEGVELLLRPSLLPLLQQGGDLVEVTRVDRCDL